MFDSETLHSRKQAVGSNSLVTSLRDQQFEASSEGNDSRSSKKSKNKLNLEAISPFTGAVLKTPLRLSSVLVIDCTITAGYM